MAEENLGFSSGPHVFVGTIPYYGDGRYTAEDLYKVVTNNLKAGVRHIDTAEAYDEVLPFVNLAIKDSKIPRNKLFISSKTSGLPVGDYSQIKERIADHLHKLGLKYLDLLLIHWPGDPDAELSEDPDKLKEKMKLELFEESIEEAWTNMVKLKEEGFTRRIGISNFYRQHFSRLIECDIAREHPPTVNQIYIDATHHELAYVKVMLDSGVQVMAYRPLEFLPALKAAGQMGDTVYAELEELQKQVKSSKSVQQMIVAWLLERGVNVCVKSSKYNHIKENLNAKKLVFPKELVDKFPKPTELSTMLLAYDVYADMFKKL